MSQNKENISILQNTRQDDKIAAWFENMIDRIRTDHLMYSSGIVTDETRKLYDEIILGDKNDFFKRSRDSSSKFFIANIIKDYIGELNSNNYKPLKLAIAMTDSRLLVWAEIKDEDVPTENALLLAEAKVNAKYVDKGFYLSSTIVEESDRLPIPQQYLNLLN